MRKPLTAGALIAVISCLILLLALLVHPSRGSAAAGRVLNKFSADFTAVMTVDKKGDLNLDLKGRVIHLFPYTRIEFEHPITMEQIVLLLDAENKNGILLYTDTLNGIEFNYSDKYYSDWPAGFPGFLSSAADLKPQGWTKRVGKLAADGTRLVELSKDEINVACKLDEKDHPLRMQVNARGRSTEFSFSSYNTEIDPDPGLFKVPADYAIQRVKELKDDEALPL